MTKVELSLLVLLGAALVYAVLITYLAYLAQRERDTARREADALAAEIDFQIRARKEALRIRHSEAGV